MKVYFFRHGKAEKLDGKKADGQRELLEKTKREMRTNIPNFARYLDGLGESKIWSSPLARAKETAQLLDEVLKVGIKEKDFIETGDYDLLFENIRNYDKDALVIVGHEPFLSDWTYRLTGEDVEYKTGEIKYIYLDDDFNGKIIWSLKSNGEFEYKKEDILALDPNDSLVEFLVASHDKIEIERQKLGKDISLDNLKNYYQALTNMRAIVSSLEYVIPSGSLNKSIARYGIEKNETLKRIYNYDSLYIARNARRKNVVKNMEKKIKKENSKYKKYVLSEEVTDNLSKALRRLVKTIVKNKNADYNMEEILQKSFEKTNGRLVKELSFVAEGDFSDVVPLLNRLQNYIGLYDGVKDFYDIEEPEYYKFLSKQLVQLQNVNYSTKMLDNSNELFNDSVETKKDKKKLKKMLEEELQNNKDDIVKNLKKQEEEYNQAQKESKKDEE